MNKKGLLIHWIVFGVLVAVGIFFLFASPIGKDSEIKGAWQLTLLRDYYLPAEKDLLKSDQIARESVWESVLALGKAGGFHQTLPCGQIDTPERDYAIWNQKDEWKKCLPLVKENLASRILERLSVQKYSEIKLDDKTVIGKGDKKSIASTAKTYVNYTYDTSFRVDLNFSVEKDYDSLLTEATELVGKCRDNSTLQQCLEDNRQQNWKFKDCEDEEFLESKQTVIFCVESPQEAKVYDSDGTLTKVRYLLAFDFSSINS